MLLSIATTIAQAADWPMVQGTESAPDPAAIRPFGFVQALGEGIANGDPVEGLTDPALAAFEEDVAMFNRIGSGDATWGASIRRAGGGLRGVIPGTGGRVAWLVAVELGENAVTRVEPLVLTDASVSFSYLPGARIRAGQFKLPLGEEALEMNALTAEFVNLSNATGQLLLESPIADGAYVGGASGFTDTGAEVFDSFRIGEGALSYAAMVSNGRMGVLDADDAKDVTGRVAFYPRIWGDRASPLREEIGIYAFWQQGQRRVDGEDAARIRRGAGLQLVRSGWNLRAELIHASGVIDAGVSPAFPGQPVSVSAEGLALGGYGFVHYERGLLGGGLRYDELQRRYDSPADWRVFRTVTADVQLELAPRARVLLDYELRSLAAPRGSADARAIAATMGDRVSAQASVVF